jgi:hypothetical protein
MTMECVVTALYHAVYKKFWFNLYFVILAHLITEKEITVSINLNLQANVQNIKTVWVLRNPCVLNALFSPRKIGFIFREVFMWNIRRNGHRENLLLHYLYLSLLYALYKQPVFISDVYPLYTTCIYTVSLGCALYTQPVFISALCFLYTPCIYLCCVTSIHNLYLSLLYALYTQPEFISAVCPLDTAFIYLFCVPSIHNLYLPLLHAFYTRPVFIYAVCPLYTTCIYTVFASGVCPLYTTCIYLCCVPPYYLE